MEACNIMSVLFYRGSKPLGKVRQRVQNLRIPSSSYCDYVASGSKLDLSHNESARFAADSLLCQGLEGYHNMLKAEGEVDFLSELEKDYILQNGSNANTDEAGEKDKMDIEFDCRSQFSSVLTNSVEYLDKKSHEDVKSAVPVSDDHSAEVFFQSDSSAAAMKDLVRQFLRKAKLALAIVMDSFSDPELLCDLLEASRKRNVSVHLLLDHLNLKVFVNVWQELELISKNFPKVSVRSVPGQTYCAKTGRKLTGQIAESFIIADWDEVLTGTYSFTWLSGQVHHNLLVLIKGSSVSHFQQEFVRLNSSSKPVPGFVTFITLPQSLCLYSTSNKPQNTVRKKRDTGLNTERIAPQLPLRPSVQPGAEYKMQSVTVGKPQHTLLAACTQLEEIAKVEQWERNQNQFHDHQNLPDPNVFSGRQSQLHSTPVITTAGNNVEVQKPHTLNAMSPTHGPQRNEHYQSALNKKNSLTHLDGSTEIVFPQQRNRNILTEPSGFTPGIETQRNQWDSSLNVYPKVELLCDQPKLLSPPTPQQIPSKRSHQITFRSPREQMSKLQPNISFQETSKQDEFMKQYQGPLNSPFYAVPSCVKPTPPGIGTCLSPQRQANSKWFLSDVQTKMHLYPVTSQQLNLTQRRHWSPQKATGPRVIGCYNSFSGTHVMGQAGWRPLQDSRNTSLERSLSMMERCTAGYRGAGLHPN